MFFGWIPLSCNLFIRMLNALHISPIILVFISYTKIRLLSISHNTMMHQFPWLDNTITCFMSSICSKMSFYLVCGKCIVYISVCSSFSSMDWMSCYCCLMCPFMFLPILGSILLWLLSPAWVTWHRNQLLLLYPHFLGWEAHCCIVISICFC